VLFTSSMWYDTGSKERLLHNLGSREHILICNFIVLSVFDIERLIIIRSPYIVDFAM